jgi:hypothetical protein
MHGGKPGKRVGMGIMGMDEANIPFCTKPGNTKNGAQVKLTAHGKIDSFDSILRQAPP